MQVIRAPNIASAHEQVCQYIMKHGKIIGTQDDEMTLEAPKSTCIVLETPTAAPMVSAYSPKSLRFLEQYSNDLIFGGKGEFEYDYHGRLCEWGKELGINSEAGINQIDQMISALKRSPATRRAVAITWHPPEDPKRKEPPCLQLVMLEIRDGKLCMKVIFRSNDMLSASGDNMFAFVSYQSWIAGILGLPVGYYEHISLNAHLYAIRDQNEAELMVPAWVPSVKPTASHAERVKALKELRSDVAWKE